MTQKSLEQYFKDCAKEGITNFRVCATIAEGTLEDVAECYIHPLDKDGDTLDFTVEGNTLIDASNSK